MLKVQRGARGLTELLSGMNLQEGVLLGLHGRVSRKSGYRKNDQLVILDVMY